MFHIQNKIRITNRHTIKHIRYLLHSSLIQFIQIIIMLYIMKLIIIIMIFLYHHSFYLFSLSFICNVLLLHCVPDTSKDIAKNVIFTIYFIYKWWIKLQLKIINNWNSQYNVKFNLNINDILYINDITLINNVISIFIIKWNCMRFNSLINGMSNISLINN